MNTKTTLTTLDHLALDASSEAGYRLSRWETEKQHDQPHRHESLILYVIQSGSGLHTIDFADHAVRPAQAHLLFPGQVHRFEITGDVAAFQLTIGRKAYEASPGFLQLTCMAYRNHPVIDLPDAVFNALRYEMEALEMELQRVEVDGEMVQLRSRVALHLVCREAERQFDDLGNCRVNPILYKYHALVDAHFRTHKTVAFYADQLHISPNYLNILCKRHLHVPATSLIHNRVALEAKRLLVVSPQSAKEVAFELGFSDLPHFSNFFKAQTGVSPRAFRNGN